MEVLIEIMGCKKKWPTLNNSYFSGCVFLHPYIHNVKLLNYSGVFKNPKGSIPPLSQSFFLSSLQFFVHVAIENATTSGP